MTYTLPGGSTITSGLGGPVQFEYSHLVTLEIHCGETGNSFSVLGTTVNTPTMLDAGSGEDDVDLGTPNQNFDFIHTIIVNGGGNTILNLDDETSTDRVFGFYAYNSTHTCRITRSSIARSDVLATYIRNNLLTFHPTGTAISSINQSNLTGLNFKGGPSGTVWNVQSTVRASVS